MHIGKKIKMIRTLRGLTQSDLAERVNKTRSLVSHIEQTDKVNHYTLQVFLKALNITQNDLENFDENPLIVSEPSTTYQTELTVLKEKVNTIIKENEMLKELISSQKKVIEMLEHKKKK